MHSVTLTDASSNGVIQILLDHPQLGSFLSSNPSFTPLFEEYLRVNIEGWWKVLIEAREVLNSPDKPSAMHDALREMETRLKTHFSESLSAGLNGGMNDIRTTLRSTVKEEVAELKENVSDTVKTAVAEPCAGLEKAQFRAIELSSAIQSDTVDIRNAVAKLSSTRTSKAMGDEGERTLEQALMEALPEYEILDSSREGRGCDFKVIRPGKAPVRIEVKNQKDMVPPRDVNRFEEDLKFNGDHGILVSIQSKISGRNNVTLHHLPNGKYAIYLSNNKYDAYAIRTFIEVIHHMDQILEENGESNTMRLSLDTLQKIADNVKDGIRNLNYARDCAKKTLDTLRDMEINMTMITSLIREQQKDIQPAGGYCSSCGKHFKGSDRRGFEGHKNNKRYVLCKNATLVGKKPVEKSPILCEIETALSEMPQREISIAKPSPRRSSKESSPGPSSQPSSEAGDVSSDGE